MYDVNTCTFCTRTIFSRYVKGVSDKRYKRLEPHAPKVKTKEKKRKKVHMMMKCACTYVISYE